MNQEQINKDLRDKDSDASDFQKHLVNIYRSFMCESSSTMSQFWYLWDKDYLRYTGYRSLDKKDVQNLKKGGTAKIIVPLSFATVQTAAANSMQMFMNKERLFELTKSKALANGYSYGIALCIAFATASGFFTYGGRNIICPDTIFFANISPFLSTISARDATHSPSAPANLDLSVPSIPSNNVRTANNANIATNT